MRLTPCSHETTTAPAGTAMRLHPPQATQAAANLPNARYAVVQKFGMRANGTTHQRHDTYRSHTCVRRW
eukprot:m.1060836 g.1060836  ORF g.1060836 m.1060836 type:complete len:69 (-) comp24209_c0_seq107:1523-1729(-)